jgi:fatty-acyl-CoA synthase
LPPAPFAAQGPRYWKFVEQFPMTASGKLQKFVLRDRFVAQGRDQRQGGAA